MAFDVDTFVSDCRTAMGESQAALAVRDVLDRAISDPASVTAALEPAGTDVRVLYGAPDLTILSVVWGPGAGVPPHDHRMWAAIGVYTGQEDNAYFRRAASPGLEAAGGRALRDGEVLLLGDDAIHSVTNPLDRYTAAIHVYGGDFVNKPRSQWDPETFVEAPYDLATMQAYLRGELSAAELSAADTAGPTAAS
jgi:predicted metal-dependent enzyme (double-stranded beta helix superfamily)